MEISFKKEITPIIWKFYRLKFSYPNKLYSLYLSTLTNKLCLYDIEADRMFEFQSSLDLTEMEVSEKLFSLCENFKKFLAG